MSSSKNKDYWVAWWVVSLIMFFCAYKFFEQIQGTDPIARYEYMAIVQERIESEAPYSCSVGGSSCGSLLKALGTAGVMDLPEATPIDVTQNKKDYYKFLIKPGLVSEEVDEIFYTFPHFDTVGFGVKDSSLAVWRFGDKLYLVIGTADMLTLTDKVRTEKNPEGIELFTENRVTQAIKGIELRSDYVDKYLVIDGVTYKRGVGGVLQKTQETKDSIKQKESSPGIPQYQVIDGVKEGSFHSVIPWYRIDKY